VTYVRTVLGDIAPDELGVTYSHEHLVIAGGKPVELFPDFRRDDLERTIEELDEAGEIGLRAVVDAMPCDAGRDVLALAEISRRTEIHVVAPTGLHHARYYDDRHWSVRLAPEEVADMFVADIEEGIDALDYCGPVVRRTAHRAGVLKVAGSDGGPSARDTRIFEAAAIAHRRTGVPILTHCEGGTGAVEQVTLLERLGVDPRHAVVSHVDKVVDTGYHREIVGSGAFVEYDQSYRWPPGAENGTLTLLEWAAGEGVLDHVVLGMDAARRQYWSTHGGSPGMTFLLGTFSNAMRAAGLGESAASALFVDNPARAFAFAEPGRAAA
jgi:phosphotriesterase-related protein